MDDDEFSADVLAKKRAEKAAESRRAQEEALRNDPELAAIVAETSQVQKDTLVSTQNSVRTIKETIVVADSTSSTLKQQGEQLDRVESKASAADANATDSYQSARELHKYKGLLPFSIKNAFTGGKKKGEDEKLTKTQKKLDKEEHKLEKQKAASGPSLVAPGTPGSAIEEEDENERAINENLDEISMGLDHLQNQASNMNQELNRQNVTIKKIDATTEHTDYTIGSANRKIQEFM